MTQNDIARRMAKDLYEVLDICSPSSPEEIKKQFRLLALKYHPDKNKDDETAEAKFKAVNEAYAILGDEQNKKMYDEMRHLMKNGFTSLHAHVQNNDERAHMQSPFVQMHNGGVHMQQPVHNNVNAQHPHMPHSPCGCPYQEDAQNYHHRPPSHQCNHGCGCYNQNYHYNGHEHCQGHRVFSPNPTYVEEPPVLFDVDVTLEEILVGAVKHVQVTRSFVNPYTSMMLQEKKEMQVTVPPGVHNGQMVGWSREGEANGFAATHFIFVVNELPHALFIREGDNLVLRIAEDSVEKDKKTIMVGTIENEDIEIDLDLLLTEPIIIKNKGLPMFDRPERGDFIIELCGPPTRAPTPPVATNNESI